MSSPRSIDHLLVKTPRLNVAVVGGGWAGLAGAVTLVRQGHRVTLYEMAGQLGGRARQVDVEGMALDNGQHILIGAYRETLRLMKLVDVDVDRVLLRRPLQLVDAKGSGLVLPAGAPVPALLAGVFRHPRWSAGERLALLSAASGWAIGRFRCAPATTVAELTASLPAAVRHELIDPLCVAALNTPAEEASGQVFLRVLRDALFTGRGSADLLLPRVTLAELFPLPAAHWLEEAGAVLCRGLRVHQITPHSDGWLVDGQRFDRVIVATPALEASRLLRPINTAWADQAEGLRYEPIITAYLRAPGARLAAPMVALAGPSQQTPAQFVFDHGQLQGTPMTSGLLAFVVSGARPWLERGLPQTEQAITRQAAALLGGDLPYGARVLKMITEKRATFRCTPNLHRPSIEVAPGLLAAGDHVAGPYPATLEGAVRAGIAAAERVTASALRGQPLAMQ
jgi:hydroxysqualene dehydroxylase